MKNKYETRNGKIFIAKGTYVIVGMNNGKKYVGELVEDYNEGCPAVITSPKIDVLPLPASNVEFVAPTTKREERQPVSNRGRDFGW